MNPKITNLNRDLLFLIFVLSAGMGYAQDAFIPDANFKSALLSNSAINTNGDGEIQISEAASFSGLINVTNLGITDLTGIEAFTSLTDLRVHNNELTSIDLSANTQLIYLHCQQNQLTSLNIHALTSLEMLRCQDNELTALDVSANTALTYLECSNNQLTSLDVSLLPALKTLLVQDNELTSLNVKNGHYIFLTSFNAENNYLTCIEVDNVAYAETNWSDDVDPVAAFSTDCGAIVYIPDANFKAVLVANLSINTNDDGEIQVYEAEAYSGQINVNSLNIADLTGIQAFTSLTDLRFHNNQVTSVDLSANIQLVQLHCQQNQLSSLDLSTLTNLQMLRCHDNKLAALDVSANTALTYLECSMNQLNFLDVSLLPALKTLLVQDNWLSSLNVKNGHNTFITSFSAENNFLTCIEVDDVAYAQANWSDDVDAGVAFSTDCPGEPVVYIPDANFKNALLADSDINVNGDDEIQVSEAENTHTMEVEGRGIADLTGIGAFKNLWTLDVSNNQLTSLDLSGLPLSNMDIRYNQISELKLGDPDEALLEFFANNNRLTSIDLSEFRRIHLLDLRNNQLTDIQLPSSPLTELYISNNHLTSLDLSRYVFLRGCDLSYNDLEELNMRWYRSKSPEEEYWTRLDVSHNPDLTCIQVDQWYIDNEYYNYYVTGANEDVTYSTDCFDSNARMIPFASVLEETNLQQLSIYPNPTAGKITISSPDEVSNVQVYTVTGQCVNVSYSGHELDISHLKSGIYFVKLYRKGAVSTVRLVKE